ncbi:hypothetical protein MVEN_00351300 [Mycena venus]|uniref:Uncharacterized protein n=1 Tax=Mycena venus TaxID=2733690 RepID=A0A8H7D9S7_9AGAR|nr:hypothetical protein MVEN_00351300 [Mycena venus]
MCDVLQLQSSILFGSLSLITNNTLCFTLLGFATGIFAIYVAYLRRPSIQFRSLQEAIRNTEANITGAKFIYPENRSIMEQEVRLLKVKRSASLMRCLMLQMGFLAWKSCWELMKEISNCHKDINDIHTAAQLAVEMELQRAYTEDIDKTETILVAVPYSE